MKGATNVKRVANKELQQGDFASYLPSIAQQPVRDFWYVYVVVQ